MLGKDTWRSWDGKEMPWRAHDAAPGTRLRAVVVTVHGLSGAASDFWMLEEALGPRGIAVHGMELRGMGHDPDVVRRGDIAGARFWARDLTTFHRLVSERHPGVPVFWYAESLGTLIALQAIAARRGEETPRPEPAGLVFSSPVSGFRIKPRLFKAAGIRAAMVLMPWKRISVEKLAGVKDEEIHVTATTTHGGRMAVTPHHVPEFTFRVVREIDRMVRKVPAAARSVAVPLLVLASPNDVISSIDQVERFVATVPSRDKTLHRYDRSYHLLLHDVQREEVLEGVVRWIEARAGPGDAGKVLADRDGSR